MDEDRDLAPYLKPLVDNAALEVDAAVRGRSLFAWGVRDGIADWLGQRLAIAVGPVLRHMRARGALGASSDGGDWARVFAAYPGLTPIVEGLITEWRERVARLIDRFSADAAGLGVTTMLRVAVVGGAWKRSPTLRLLCATPVDGGGPSQVVWYYKDHALGIGAWLMRLLDELAQVGLTPALHVRRIEPRAGYGWDREVPAATCADAGEAERFYIRAGMWVRLLQVLGGNDLHAKNLVSAGEHPVPIDHENLFQPLRATGASALEAAARALQESPLEGGLLPRPLAGEPGRRAVNAGGLEPGGTYRLPFMTAGGVPEIVLPRTYPMLASGEVVAPRAEWIVAGFEHMSALLSGSGRRVLAALVPLAAQHEVRVLSRPAHVTRRLAIDSLQPDVLAREGARAQLLARRAHRDDVAALTALEVPRHYAFARIDRLRAERTPERLAWDRALIATTLGQAGVGSAVVVVGGDERELLRAAVGLGDTILSEAHADRGALHWLGVAWQPLAAARTIDVLPPDLLSGNAGLAVVLAALAKVTREARFADAAKKALGPVTQALHDTKAAWRPWGAYVGAAGQAYAQERVAELVGAAAPEFPLTAIVAGPSGGVDLACGTAGLVAVAARLPARRKAGWLGALCDVLDKAKTKLPPLPYPDGAAPADLPTPASGIAFALARAGRAGAATSPGHERAAFDASRAAADAAFAHGFDVGPAAALMRTHAATGAWLPGSGLADRLNLGGMRGLGAVALSLLRAAAPEAALPNLWKVD